MKTIVLPIYTSEDNKKKIVLCQKQFSNIVHYSYNRLIDNNLTTKEIEHSISSLNNIDLMDSWFIRCARVKSESILESVKALNKITERNNERKKDEDKIKLINPKKVIFGTKYNFYQRLTGKISKEEYQENRLLFINVQGEANQKGNRKFTLDLDNNQIIFKPKCREKIILQLPKLRKPLYKELKRIQELSTQEITEDFKGMCFQIELSSKEIHISFDELATKNFKITSIKDRILGIDLNPNFIGYSISDFKDDENKNILSAKCFDLTKLNKNLEVKSNDKKHLYQTNKRQFEIIQIVKSIISQAVHFKTEKIVIEDLNLPSEDKHKGKEYNRLVNNCWNRQLFIRKLKMDARIFGIKVIEVNPMYSSFIGNLQHNYFDPVSSSLEIARRGLSKFVKGSKLFPSLSVKDHWKKYLIQNISDWKSLYQEMRDLKYRVSLEESKEFSNFKERNCIKSYTSLYNFI